ncbi:unnamed protein product [Urochloa humidicola]
MVSPGAAERVTGPMSVLAGLALVWKLVCHGPFLEPLREQLHDLASRFVRRAAATRGGSSVSRTPTSPSPSRSTTAATE